MMAAPVVLSLREYIDAIVVEQFVDMPRYLLPFAQVERVCNRIGIYASQGDSRMNPSQRLPAPGERGG